MTSHRHDSFTFQSPSPGSPSVLALEGLFTTLCQRLEQLTQVRTDLPDDYVARCKATFTDQLLTELEGQGYHSPAFDRLIALRDAYDNGTLTPETHGREPHENETQAGHAPVPGHRHLPRNAAAGRQPGNHQDTRGVRRPGAGRIHPGSRTCTGPKSPKCDITPLLCSCPLHPSPSVRGRQAQHGRSARRPEGPAQRALRS